MANKTYTLSINSEYFDELNKLISGKEIDHVEHFKNALELYALTIEGIVDHKTPVLFNPKSKKSNIIPLPPVLALLHYNKNLEINNTVTINIGLNDSK